MATDVSEVLKRLDGFAFIRELYSECPEPDQSSEVRIFCPFHDDKPNASASFNVNNKLFRCFNCNASGSAVDLLAQLTRQPRHVAAEYLARQLGISTKTTINSKLVEEWHAALRMNRQILDELMRRQGIDVASVERWRLGWIQKDQRLMIPVRDEDGNVVNVRQYDLLKVYDVKKKYLNIKGHGQLRLFHEEALKQDTVVITEGELKTIGLIQRGVNAMSTTGGAAGWKDGWDRLFENKTVYLCYDVDATGEARARALARRLIKVAKEVRVLTLPLDTTKHPHGDVLDYFVKEGYTANDFNNLMLGTPPWSPTVESTGLRDDIEYEVELGAASKAQYFLRKVKLPVIVSAKDTAPYIAPKDMRVNCGRDLEICPSCPVFTQAEETVWTVEADDPDLLKLIDVTAKTQNKELKELIGIPGKCTSSELAILDTHNIEEVRLVPQLVTSGVGPSSSEQIVARAYHVGHGIETNATYEARARSVTEPKTQHATLLIYEAEPNVDSLSAFSPSKEELQELEIFRPSEWTVMAINVKFDELYRDLENNITRIYQRRHLHVLMDLVWHSVLYVPLTAEPSKGWVDALVLGDTGQGKSETMLRLLGHYGIGEKIDMKSASVAGLKGGLQDTQGRWFVTWGVIPLNDRRLVILDEVKGCKPEVLQALTDMRSSGLAELVKIERRRSWARTRLLWISNPRSDRRIETYSFGVQAIKELMGSLEDVRRFDAALIVATGEVDPAVIARSIIGEPVPHIFTSDRCRRLILWSWSRAVHQILVEPEAKQACLELALEHSRRYSSSIPLVEPADHRLKLARLGSALAARTFSADETGQKLVVRLCHIEWVAKFLDEIYSSRFMGYDVYSEIQHMEAKLGDSESIRIALMGVPFPLETVRGLMRSNEVRVTDLMDWSGTDKDTAKDILSILVRGNALQRKQSGYYKTGAFIEFLKSLKMNGSIPEHIRRELEKTSDY